jgi:hypothetical protein
MARRTVVKRLGTLAVILGVLGSAWQTSGAQPERNKSDALSGGKDLTACVAKVEWIAATEAARDAARKAGQPPRMVRVWIDLRGPLAAGASGYGRLRIDQLRGAADQPDMLEWQSPAAKPADRIEDSLYTIHRGVDEVHAGPWLPQSIKEGVRFYLDVDAGQPMRQISLLRGTLVLRAGGRYETLSIKNVLQHLGKPIDDPTLKACGITVIPRDGSEPPSAGGVTRITMGSVTGSGIAVPAPSGKEVLVETNWTRSPVMRLSIIDPEAPELSLPTSGSSAIASENTVNLWSRFRFEPPKDAQLTLVVHRNPRLVQARFTLKEIDFSQGEWIIVPQSAADVPKSANTTFPVAAMPAEPPVKVKSAAIEILPGTVEVATADLAAPAADAPPSAVTAEAMKSKDGYPLGHMAGPSLAGCGVSTSSNPKNPAAPVSVMFNFDCPAENLGDEAEPGSSGADVSICVLGPPREQYARSWAQVSDDLDLNLDFSYLPKDASRTVDLELLEKVRGLSGFHLQGPAQGARLVVRGDLGFLAGQRKIRRLWLSDCDVSARMVRNMAAVPNLRILHLFNCKFAGDALAELAAAKSLRCLNLKQCVFDEKSLLPLIPSLPELRHLVLARTPITDRALASLPPPAEIQYLDLSGTQAGDRTLEALKQFRKLQVVNLEGIPLRARQIRALADACPLKAISYTPCAGIEKLYEELGRRNIGVYHGTGTAAHCGLFDPDYLNKVAGQIPKQFTQVLVMCDLSEIGPRQVDTLNRLQADWTTCDFVGATAAPKADVLAGLRGASCITLCGVGLAEQRYDMAEHYATILAGWRQSAKLAELEINGCPIRHAAAASLVEIPSLRALSLLHTGVRDWIGPLLVRAKKLERLRLREPELGDAVVAELAKVKTLRRLDLSETAIGDASLDALLAMPALKEVHLFGCGVSKAACEKLRKHGIMVSAGRLCSTQSGITFEDAWQQQDSPMQVGIR